VCVCACVCVRVCVCVCIDNRIMPMVKRIFYDTYPASTLSLVIYWPLYDRPHRRQCARDASHGAKSHSTVQQAASGTQPAMCSCARNPWPVLAPTATALVKQDRLTPPRPFEVVPDSSSLEFTPSMMWLQSHILAAASPEGGGVAGSLPGVLSPGFLRMLGCCDESGSSLNMGDLGKDVPADLLAEAEQLGSPEHDTLLCSLPDGTAELASFDAEDTGLWGLPNCDHGVHVRAADVRPSGMRRLAVGAATEPTETVREARRENWPWWQQGSPGWQPFLLAEPWWVVRPS
jgi:hypothetical protein